MIDTYYRSNFQKFLIDPITPYLLKLNTHPNYLTFLGLLLGVTIAPLLSFNLNVVATICLLFSGYFDILDGALARLSGKSTPLGSVFDIISDRIVEFSIVFGLYLVAPEERGLLCLLILGSILFCVTSFLVVGIFTQNESEKGFHYSPGIMERTEAFIFFSIMILIPSFFYLLAPLFIALVTLTALIRIKQFASSEKFALL